MYPRVSLSAQSQLALTHQLEQGAGRAEDDDVWANLVEVRGGEGSQNIYVAPTSEKEGGKSSNPWSNLYSSSWWKVSLPMGSALRSLPAPNIP